MLKRLNVIVFCASHAEQNEATDCYTERMIYFMATLLMRTIELQNVAVSDTTGADSSH